MKTLDYIDLDGKRVENVIVELKQLLADFQVFYTNLRGFHWNIKGRGFFILHAKFEGMYNDVSNKIDELAERILQLGGVAPHNFSDYLKVSKIKETGLVDKGDDAIANIMDSYKHFITSERLVIDKASAAGDEVTVALMSDYLKEQEKMMWMLVAYNS
ncbi:MAG: DNA starvation/stationary phase protection protein [Muribaculaceae bacterium]